MNIFIVDQNPTVAAQMLCDRHVNKMILETAQMLTAVADRHSHPTLYKVAYKNHPCTLWAGDTYANWLWLTEHGLALNEEKIYRTGKSHISAEVIKYYRDNGYGPIFDKDSELTNFALAMPTEYQNHKNPVESYRNYYLNEKQWFKDGKRPTWTKRPAPDWWKYR